MARARSFTPPASCLYPRFVVGEPIVALSLLHPLTSPPIHCSKPLPLLLIHRFICCLLHLHSLIHHEEASIHPHLEDGLLSYPGHTGRSRRPPPAQPVWVHPTARAVHPWQMGQGLKLLQLAGYNPLALIGLPSLKIRKVSDFRTKIKCTSVLRDPLQCCCNPYIPTFSIGNRAFNAK